MNQAHPFQLRLLLERKHGDCAACSAIHQSILHRWPYPLAVCYHQLCESQGVFQKQSAAVRLAECCFRYLALVNAADLFSRQLEGEQASSVRALLEVFVTKTPSMGGTWRKAMQAAYRCFQGLSEPAFLSSFPAFWEAAEQETIKRLNEYRNKIAHEHVYLDIVNVLGDFLGSLSFLGRYHLGVVRGYRGGPESVLSWLPLVGTHRHPQSIEVAVGQKMLFTSRPILLSLDRQEGLYLDPFLVWKLLPGEPDEWMFWLCKVPKKNRLGYNDPAGGVRILKNGEIEVCDYWDIEREGGEAKSYEELLSGDVVPDKRLDREELFEPSGWQNIEKSLEPEPLQMTEDELFLRRLEEFAQGVSSFDVRISLANQAQLSDYVTRDICVLPKVQHEVCFVGDALMLEVVASEDCYLYIFNVGSSGTITMLLPNCFSTDNYIKGGNSFLIPSERAPFELKLSGPPGIEIVHVFASRACIRSFDELRLPDALASMSPTSFMRDIEVVGRRTSLELACAQIQFTMYEREGTTET